MKAMTPANQKALYQTAANLVAKLENWEEEVDLARIDRIFKGLDIMNNTYSLEIQRTKMEYMIKEGLHPVQMRTVEKKAFDNIPLE